MRKLIDDIIRGRRNDSATLPLRLILGCLSIVYGFAVMLRNVLYDRNILKPKSVPCRVVSIGNLTVGGTGKTPAVIMTARMLVDGGCSVAVVSRGYGRGGKGTAVVSDGFSILLSPEEAGDEPHIVAGELTGVPVVVGNDRRDAAQTAFERFRPDVILLDDGFQHRRLARNADVVTVDAGNPWGDGHLLPLGLLRESPSSLKRAQAVMMTRFTDDISRDGCERTIRCHDGKIPIFFSGHRPVRLRKPFTGDSVGLAYIAGRKTAALSNVADPGSFHRMLVDLGADIVHTAVMPDHHRYTEGELREISEDAAREGANLLVMTAKDERNLPASWSVGSLEAVVLDIEAFLHGDEGSYLELVKPESPPGRGHPAKTDDPR